MRAGNDKEVRLGRLRGDLRLTVKTDRKSCGFRLFESDFGEYHVSLDKDGGCGLTVSVVALTLLVQCRRYRSILPAFGAALSFV